MVGDTNSIQVIQSLLPSNFTYGSFSVTAPKSGPPVLLSSQVYANITNPYGSGVPIAYITNLDVSGALSCEGLGGGGKG